MKKFSLIGALLASVSLVPVAVYGQQTREDEETRQRDDQPSGRSARSQFSDDNDEEIVVAGQRLRGSVVGDIQPELTYNAGDVRALGVSDISELVAELAPQLTSGRGGQPIVLLEGRRVSSFREIATIPSEAIQRVEILPEEVALKYGYSPDQKVMNIVLRRRFRAFTLEGKDSFSTDGGANKVNGELGFLTIRRGGRLNLNVEYDRQAMLMESDRGVFNKDAQGVLSDTQRSLVPSERELTVTGTYAKPLSDKINASINAEVTTDQTLALTGLSARNGIVIPDGPLYSRDALARSTSGQTARLGATINADGKVWHSTLTTSYTHDESRTITDGRYEIPSSGLLRRNPSDLARSRSDVAQADLTSNASLYRLPAGDISLTLRLGGTLSAFTAERTNFDSTVLPEGGQVYRASDLSRNIGLGSVSLDIPLVKSPSPFIGRLSVNGNAEVQSLSDFGTIKGYGFGMNWRPRTGVSFIASYNSAETAPTVQQLGNPQIKTQNVQVFDYQTGQTVTIEQTSGGNPNLLIAEQKDFRLGTTVKPFTNPDLTFSVDYNHRLTRNGVGSLPGTTDAAEQAFGDRFTRDPLNNNRLQAIDSRSVNIARQESSSIRWGLNFTKTIKTSQAQMDAMRAAMQKAFPNGFPGRPGGPGGEGGEGGPRPDGAQGRPAGNSGSGSSRTSGASAFGGGGIAGGGGARAGGGFGGPGGPGGGGFGGGPGGPGGRGGMGGGRINFAVYHTVNLTSVVQLRDGLPEIDLMNGGTLGEQAGEPRHEVEFQSGYSQNGIGLRLTGKWQSATRVVGTATGTRSSDLRFSDIATFNLRLFANLGQRPELVGSMPWLRGARLQIGVNNIFNTRQRVTDGNGVTPDAYRPGLIDAQGRTIQISFRKQLF
ncbi:MAG: TonB-dependent receptor [Sphingobium sp.]